jgi:hypothetical protein
MSQLAEIAELPSSPSTRPYSQWFEVSPALGISLMDHLYNRLDGAYPNKWRANFANQQAIDNWQESWVEAFEEEGITPADVKAGLRECRKRYTWPPSCAEFIQACKPSVDPLVAYHEAIAGIEARGKGEWGTWSHPAIYWAAMLLRVDLMGQSYGQIKDRWASVLKGHLDRNEWAEIPPPRKLLPPPETSPVAKDLAEKMVKELGATGVLKTEVQGDGRGWARKILEREKRGEKIAITVSKMAREALGLETAP